MRQSPVLLFTASALALAVALTVSLPTLAQDPNLPGCTQGNPCEVIVDVDSKGIDSRQTEFTKGDWVLFSIFNGDDVPHTVTLAGHNMTVVVGPDDIEDSRPVQLARVGTYALRDMPTRDEANLTVLEEDAFSNGDTSSGGSSHIPGFEAAFLVGTLAVSAIALRRRT